jgi:hypothetical protein
MLCSVTYNLLSTLNSCCTDDLDSSNFAKALGVMGFEGATKGTFKHGMKRQVGSETLYIEALLPTLRADIYYS